MAKPGISPEAFRKAVDNYADTVVKKIAVEAHGVVVKEVYRRILERTPVLTGRARRNWNISFNAPDSETTEEVAGAGATGAPWDAQERQRARDVLGNLRHARIGSTIWIANFLPYIQFLEEGKSTKAPQGIVQGAIQGALEELSSKGLKAKVRE